MQKVSKGPGYTEVIEEVEDGNMATKGWGYCGHLYNSDGELDGLGHDLRVLRAMTVGYLRSAREDDSGHPRDKGLVRIGLYLVGGP